MVKFCSTPILSKVLIKLSWDEIFCGKLLTNIEPWVINKCNIVNKYINYWFYLSYYLQNSTFYYEKTHFVFDRWFILSMKATCPFLLLPFLYEFIYNFIGKLGFSDIATTWLVNLKQPCVCGILSV